jgi:hypothetical protein
MALRGKANEDPVPDQCQVDVIQALWLREPALSIDDIQSWETYFRYYTAECRKAIEYNRGDCTTVRRHEDIIAIADQLRRHDSKETIKLGLSALDTQQRSEEVKEQMAEGSLRLAVRIFAMVDTGPTSGKRIQGPAPLPWKDDTSSLRAVLANHFTKSTTNPRGVKFHKSFTVFNIQRFAGLEIRWTDNLADHLRFIEDDTTLCIFHHITFLRHYNR